MMDIVALLAIIIIIYNFGKIIDLLDALLDKLIRELKK